MIASALQATAANMKPFRLVVTALLLASVAAGESGETDSAAPSSSTSAAAPDTSTAPAGSQRSGRFFSYVSRLLGLRGRRHHRRQPKPVVVAVPHVQHVHRPIKISPVIVIKPHDPPEPYPVPCTGWGCQECDDYHPCASGRCWSGHCVQCLWDSDCGAGYTCASHECVHHPEPEPVQCLWDSDCGAGYACESHHCVHKPVPDFEPVQCLWDSDCGDGYACESYHCVHKPEPEVQCQWDSDCGAGYTCESHQCVHKPEPEPEKPEKCEYSRCPAGQYCARDSACKPYVLPGYPCDGTESCESNSCYSGVCSACSHWKPCVGDEYCSRGTCNPPGGVGDECWVDLQCRSHICRKGKCAECAQRSDCPRGQQCKNGLCKERGRNGDECSSAADCKSNNCNEQTGQCVDCTNSLQCADLQYCNSYFTCQDRNTYKQPCGHDNECLSGKCNNNQCVLCKRNADCDREIEYCDKEEGRCNERPDFGDKCKPDKQCRKPFECKNKKCVECVEDEDCKDGNKKRCKDNKCVKKSKPGEKCDEKSDCESNICIERKCRECNNRNGDKGPCPSGQACFRMRCLPNNVERGGVCESGLNEQCKRGDKCDDMKCIKP